MRAKLGVLWVGVLSSCGGGGGGGPTGTLRGALVLEQSPPRSSPATRSQAQAFVDLERVDVDFVAGDVLVCGARGLAPGVARQFGLVLRARGGAVERWHSHGVALSREGRAAQMRLVRDVRDALPEADYVCPNLRYPIAALAGLGGLGDPNDPLFAKAQFNLQLCDFRAAWQLTTGAEDVTVGVLDTGILAGHPDLAGRISPLGYDFISDLTNAADGDGPDGDPEEPRTNGPVTLFHGTYVTGILAAASDNGVGITGATWRGQVIPVRAFGALGATSFDIIQSLRYFAGLSNASNRTLSAAERPRVVNLSYAANAATSGERAEVRNLAQAGVHLVSAAGNGGKNASPPVYPAAWPEVIAVAGVDRDLKRASYSNAGSFVEIAAVGGTEISGPGGVMSTWGTFVGGEFRYVYNTFRGTSVATPSVAGAVALIVSVFPGIDNARLRGILGSTARDLGAAGRDDEFGHGLLQAGAAVRKAKEIAPPLLDLEPVGFDFGDDVTRAVMRVTNRGGGTLDSLRVLTTGAVSGAIRPSLSSASAPAELVATLDRAAVRVGTYTDRYQLVWSGGRREFELRFRKPIPVPSRPIELRVYEGDRLVARAEAAPDGSFEMGGLAFGAYRFEAGVDRDGNGRLGDSEEWFLSRSVQVRPERAAELNGLVVPWKD